MDKLKERIFNDRFLVLIWKASHCQVKSNRTLSRTLIRIDLIECLNLITSELNRKTSLRLLASLMLGLCNVLTYQTNHCLNNQANCLWTSLQTELSNWIDKTDSKKLTYKRSMNCRQTADSSEAYLQLLKNFEKQFKSFIGGTYPKIETISQNRHLVDLYEMSCLHQQSNHVQSDADIYFEHLNNQVNSVDFVDECQNILLKYFGNADQLPGERKRFSDAHPSSSIEDVFDQCTSTDDTVHCTPTNDTVQKKPTDIISCPTIKSAVHPRSKRICRLSVKNNKPKRDEKSEINMKKLSKKSKLVYSTQIGNLIRKWKDSKLGYECLLRECQDQNLSEPSRGMTNILKKYYKASQSSILDCNESFHITSLKTDQVLMEIPQIEDADSFHSEHSGDLDGDMSIKQDPIIESNTPYYQQGDKDGKPEVCPIPIDKHKLSTTIVPVCLFQLFEHQIDSLDKLTEFPEHFPLNRLFEMSQHSKSVIAQTFLKLLEMNSKGLITLDQKCISDQFNDINVRFN